MHAPSLVALDALESWLALCFVVLAAIPLALAALWSLTRPRPDGPGERIDDAPPAAALAPSPSRTTMHPLFLNVEAGAWVLDGTVDDVAHRDAPVTLTLRPPDSAWLGAIIEGLLGIWVTEDRAIDLDLTKVDRPHRPVALTCERTTFWLEAASVSPWFPGVGRSKAA